MYKFILDTVFLKILKIYLQGFNVLFWKFTWENYFPCDFFFIAKAAVVFWGYFNFPCF